MQNHLHRLHGVPASMLATCLVLFLPFNVLGAPPTFTDAVGGKGGTFFQSMCAAGEFLVGIRANAGQVIDRIGAACAPWDPARRATGPSHDIPEYGGTGGTPTHFDCPPNFALSGWLIEDSRGENPLVVGNIAEQECRSLTPPHGAVATKSTFIGHTQNASGGILSGEHFKSGPVWARCPSGQLANGLYGNSGILVDRVGLMCATPATVILGPPAPAAPPAKVGARGPLGKRATPTTIATAKDDVDVYDQPDGSVGKVINVMGKGQSHPVIKQGVGWSDLQDAAGPGQSGWVANDHLIIVTK